MTSKLEISKVKSSKVGISKMKTSKAMNKKNKAMMIKNKIKNRKKLIKELKKLAIKKLKKMYFIFDKRIKINNKMIWKKIIWDWKINNKIKEIIRKIKRIDY